MIAVIFEVEPAAGQGAAYLQRAGAQGWLREGAEPRVLQLTPPGRQSLGRVFGEPPRS